MTSHPSDFIAQATFLGPDEIQFAKQKARRSAPKIALPPIPDGPCCHRCANWNRPEDADDFGICTRLAAISEKVTMGPERGTVVSVAQAMTQADWAWEHLPIRGFAEGCSLYRANGGQ